MKIILPLLAFLISITVAMWLCFGLQAAAWTVICATGVAAVSIIGVVTMWIETCGDKSPDMPGYDD